MKIKTLIPKPMEYNECNPKKVFIALSVYDKRKRERERSNNLIIYLKSSEKQE